MCDCSPGEDWRRAAADDQSSPRGAQAGGGQAGAPEETETESDAKGERSAKGQYHTQYPVPPLTLRLMPTGAVTLHSVSCEF